MRIINRVSLHRYHRYLTRRFLSRFKSDVSPETLPSSRGFLITVVYSPQSLPLTSLYLFFSCSSFLLSRTKSRVERLSKLTILGKEQCGGGWWSVTLFESNWTTNRFRQFNKCRRSTATKWSTTNTTTISHVDDSHSKSRRCNYIYTYIYIYRITIDQNENRAT